jgi:lipopolysaccharide/colanic/teichoic acid biosynthesis glycosyltransferase
MRDGQTAARRRAGAGTLGKRAVDLVGGTALAIVATPVVLGLAIGSGIALRAWPLFVQERIGTGGRRFRILKIRTLPRDAHAYALKHDVDASTLPRYCLWLRRFHLDELPQLWLVPFGRISLVGPRPRMPDEHEPVDPAYAALRLRVPQGCTCLWQIGEHTDALPSDAPEYDAWYVAHATLRLDAWILWRTALKMVGLGTPRSLRDVPPWTGSGGRGAVDTRRSVVE